MNNDVELEGRPRPLSTGLWTLFSWLRRDERSESSDSLSSAGSDRTVASFAFLTPAHYQSTTNPVVLRPPGPPTDSYKKRVHERNLRRHYDRDVTLHRKYGLFKSEETSCGYDALTLPPVRRIISEAGSRWDRDRRATSECYPRRVVHVPGKRRAPLPPVATAPTPPTTLNRRTRKRPAPQPPIKVLENNKENRKNLEDNKLVTQMNPHTLRERQKLLNNDVTMGCKSEKYSKKEGSTKDSKLKCERGFLKQIFDSKKKYSGVEIPPVKLLPSISELDKQAAEIIENSKINASEKNNNIKKQILEKKDKQSTSQSEVWICVSCFRKYDMSIVKCLNCPPNEKVNSDQGKISKASSSYTQTEKTLSNTNSKAQNTSEEKQKLKEMLKEMKDSLPKRPKHELSDKLRVTTATNSATCEKTSYSTEMPTLRVGCVVQSSTSDNILKSSLKTVSAKNELLPSPTVIQSVTPVQVTSSFKKYQNSIKSETNKDIHQKKEKGKPRPSIEAVTVTKLIIDNSENLKTKRDLHTPLRISSLLNPVYVPKNLVSNKLQGTPTHSQSQAEKQKLNGVTSNIPSTVSQHVGNPNMSANVLAGPSTSHISRLPMSSAKMEIKCNVERENTAPEPVSPQSNKLVKKNTEIELKENKQSEILTTTSSTKDQNIIKEPTNLDQHTKRRDLIHQLEQSIAKGDERAAAEAAAKLAQLRLSCSVLSFSSQILSQPSTSKSKIGLEGDKITTGPVLPKLNVSIEKIRNDQAQLSSLKDGFQNRANNDITGSSFSTPRNVEATPKVSATSIKDRPKKEACVFQNSTPEAKNNNPTTNQTIITIAVMVEDKEATRGPVPLRINRQALIRDLRKAAETSLGLPINLQRWIVGRVLCVNDDTPIISLAGPDFSAPFYLCVVESEKKSGLASQAKSNGKTSNDENKLQTKVSDVYTELMQLEQQAIVPNTENFECGVCMEVYTTGRGVVLRECVHTFCKECLAQVVRHCGEPDIPCPAMGCPGMLQEREIRALVNPEEYERWLARGLAAAESGTRNAFHCRTQDCEGWALCEPEVRKFPCPVCKHTNCVPCQAIHDNLTCEQHRAKLKQAATGKRGNPGATDDGTRTLLNSLIAKGEALECPQCKAIITKKWGCDWVKCSACKTEICWVTRGRRWGPGGKGDVSGGCRCGVDGKRCHPSCGYCH